MSGGWGSGRCGRASTRPPLGDAWSSTCSGRWLSSVIAVAVVGGTSLDGGKGSLLGTFTAAIQFSALNNALNLLSVTSYWQYVAVGIVLLLALVIAGLRDGRIVFRRT